MNSHRIGLIVLQAIGALSILPYPAILVANVMSIAAPGQSLPGALPFLLLSLYPLLWIALDWMSWVHFKRGDLTWAYGLSAVPVVIMAIGLAFAVVSTASGLKQMKDRRAAFRAEVEQANPLAWSIMAYYGFRYEIPNKLPLQTVLSQIETAQRINEPVAKHGTPLGIALWNFRIKWDWDGVSGDEEQRGTQQIIRALVARGARLSTEEAASPIHVCRLRLAMMEGPNATAVENPLVWSIIKGDLTYRAPFFLTKAERTLLNKPTRLYGTPLAASKLLPNSNYISTQLFALGAEE